MALDGVEWMVCHSDHKYRLQPLLLVICQFSESERWEISDCERIYLCFDEAGKDQESVNPHETLSLIWVLDAALIGRMAERGEGIVTTDGG